MVGFFGHLVQRRVRSVKFDGQLAGFPSSEDVVGVVVKATPNVVLCNVAQAVDGFRHALGQEMPSMVCRVQRLASEGV